MLIFGVTGGCRGEELTAVKIDYLTDYGNEIIVNIPEPKKNIAKLFVISGEYAKFVRKYMQIRPPRIASDRFFLKYSQGECENSVIGKNKIAMVPKEIAKFLNLDDYKSYTGHSFQSNNFGSKRRRRKSNVFSVPSDASKRAANNSANLDNVIVKSECDDTPMVSGSMFYEITKLDEHQSQSHRPIIPMLSGTVALTKRKPLLYTGMQASRFVRLQKLADEWNFPELKLLLTLRKLHLDEDFEILGDAFDLDKSTSERYYHESRHTVLGLVDRLETTTSCAAPTTNSHFDTIFEPIIKIENCDSPYVSDPIGVDCSMTFDELDTLNDSASEVNADDDDYDDVDLGLPTLSKEEDKGWLSDDIRKRTAECSVCHKFYVPRLLNSHMESVHFNLANLNRTICGLCWQEFATETLLRSHQKAAHHGGSHGCDICGKTFASKRYLSVHILSRHTQLKTYLCDTCGEGFPVPFSLQDHVKRKHMIRGHDCHLCKMKFVTAAALNDHFVARHTDERRFTCDFKGCGKTFKWRSSFKSHRRVHASDKYECSVCLKRFSFKGNLRNHLKTIHNQIVENECLTSNII